MSTQRRQFTSAFKAQIALEALKEVKTITQIAADHQLHPNLVTRWRQDLLTQMPSVFERKDTQAELLQAQEHKMATLYEQIGRLSTQLAWVKKKSGLDPDAV